jgi:transcriptional regulator with XRE-family HTH domain
MPSKKTAAARTGPADSPAQAEAAELLRIGAIARELRKRAGLALQPLAERAGISTAMLSQIERGLSTPSLRSLRLLSEALEVPISRFFEESAQPRPPSFVVRTNERRRLRLSPTGVIKDLISPDSPSWIEMYELRLLPGGSSGNDFHRHDGEKAGYVLEGQLQLMLGQESFVLNPGDAFRFPSVVPHMFRNPSESAARIIWINASAATRD